MTRKLLAVALLLVVGLAPAGANPSPATAAIGTFSLSQGVTRQVLPNGLVVLVKEDHSTNTVAVELLTQVGAAQEDPQEAGIEQLIASSLERRVSQDPNSPDDLVEATGSVVHSNVNPDFSEVGLETTNEHFNAMFGRVLNAYQQRHFIAKEVEPERRELLHGLQGEQRVFTAIYDIFLQSFYRYYPYCEPQTGRVSTVKNLTLDQLDHFYADWYVPNRTVLAVVGDVKTADVMQQVTQTLGTLGRVDTPTQQVQWKPVESEKELQLAAGSGLAWIFLGYPAASMSSPDYAAMRVMHALMGEGVSSRLWVDLREERGLAYELGSMYPALQGPAHFLAYMITTPQQLRLARQRMFAEMDRLRTEDVSPT
ncbi:MAG: M16 family metallopeptidase, partial [Candidatus Xenobia bacterium]